jgi:hypothetical protein
LLTETAKGYEFQRERERELGRIVKNVSEEIRRCRYIIMPFYTAAN